jgi:hypothetical protein
MNIVEQLKSWGATIEDQNIDIANNGKFLLSRDVSSSQEFVYVLSFNKIPSHVYLEYKLTRFEEFAKYLIGKGFSVIISKSYFGREVKHSIMFKHSVHRIILELSNVADSKYFETGDDEPSSENIGINIWYDPFINTDIAYEIHDKFGVKDHNENKGKVLLFEKDEYNNIVLTPHKVKSYDLDLENHYNDDFKEVHTKIENWIGNFSSPNNKLILLHGIQGSGKTNYIKYLLNSNSDVKKIYIPPYFVQSIADPAFFPIIKKEKESLLIIEDAEKILLSREENGDNSVISILLNLCDGIMADVLNFKIIATFNTDESRIDSALKRKGRMFLKYMFGELSEAKTANLFKSLHGQEPPKKQMTLAEIYNDENEFGTKKQVRKVGFGV